MIFHVPKSCIHLSVLSTQILTLASPPFILTNARQSPFLSLQNIGLSFFSISLSLQSCFSRPFVDPSVSQILYSLYKGLSVVPLIIFTALSLSKTLFYSCYASSNILPPVPAAALGVPFPPNFFQILLISVFVGSDPAVVAGISQKMLVPRTNRACPSESCESSHVLRSTCILSIIRHTAEGPKL